ncbi:hypothetical protein JTB14_021180 [Gonioctena quinquepunctata]|nr:hypothetical protein JTB14_021180 [Gonioctena quinquepunctata]
MEKCVLIFPWWLGKGDTLISVSDMFNVALSTVYSAVEFVIPKIPELQMKYISWPNQQKALNIERAFRAKSGFPGVIGAIDGCNSKFKCPIHQQESYIDKNKTTQLSFRGNRDC